MRCTAAASATSHPHMWWPTSGACHNCRSSLLLSAPCRTPRCTTCFCCRPLLASIELRGAYFSCPRVNATVLQLPASLRQHVSAVLWSGQHSLTLNGSGQVLYATHYYTVHYYFTILLYYTIHTLYQVLCAGGPSCLGEPGTFAPLLLELLMPSHLQPAPGVFNHLPSTSTSHQRPSVLRAAPAPQPAQSFRDTPPAEHLPHLPHRPLPHSKHHLSQGSGSSAANATTPSAPDDEDLAESMAATQSVVGYAFLILIGSLSLALAIFIVLRLSIEYRKTNKRPLPNLSESAPKGPAPSGQPTEVTLLVEYHDQGNPAMGPRRFMPLKVPCLVPSAMYLHCTVCVMVLFRLVY